MTTKFLTLRLPPDLYQSSRLVAEQRHISLNALIQESLQALVRAEQQRRLFDDYTRLGEDAEGCDVDYALAAQREVILAGDAPEPRP